MCGILESLKRFLVLDLAIHLGDSLRVLVRAVARCDDSRAIHLATPIRHNAIAHHRRRLVFFNSFSTVAADDVIWDAHGDLVWGESVSTLLRMRLSLRSPA